MADTIDVHSTRDTRDDDLINGMLKWRRYDTSDETPVIDEETTRDTREGASHDGNTRDVTTQCGGNSFI
jgi:hypothetical protein